jgi:uncharacterized protein
MFAMSHGSVLTTREDIQGLLEKVKTVAVLGLSPKPDRDSHRVARYLQDKGYKIIPVRPGQTEILGEKVYKSLDELEGPVDLVDVFRRSEQVDEHLAEILRLKPRAVWMQLGIRNEEVAKALTEAGIDVVMDRCVKVDHANFIHR